MNDELTRLENESIRSFVGFAAANGYLSGRVLDYGCGKQPYRDIVEAAGGEYHGYDHDSFPAHVGSVSVGTDPTYAERFDAILCTQVLQYVPIYSDDRYTPPFDLRILLGRLWGALREGEYHLKPRGHLILTYPTNWPEVQDVDLHRFTKAGMERLLTEAGFTIIEHIRRATIHSTGYEWALGYGVVARA